MPLIVQVTDTNGVPLTNAPVAFTVSQGTLSLRTDTNGQAATWLVLLPGSNGAMTVCATAQSGTNVTEVSFTELVGPYIAPCPAGLVAWWRGEGGREL